MAEVVWHLFRRPDHHMSIVVYALGSVLGIEMVMLLLAQHYTLVIIWGGCLATTLVTLGIAFSLRRTMRRYCLETEALPLPGVILDPLLTS